MKFRCILYAALCAFPLTAFADALKHVRIDTPDASAVAAKLTAAGFDVLAGSVSDDSLELIVSTSESNRLAAMGLESTTLANGRPFSAIQGEWDKPVGYLNLAEIRAVMDAAAIAFPDLCQVVDLTVTYNMPTTFEGRHLFAVKISDNVMQDEDEPTFLMVSDHHAREIVTPVIAMHTIEQLTTRYGSDPQITRLVDDNEI